MKEHRSTIFADKKRKKLVENTYSAEKRSICRVHLELAHKINSIFHRDGHFREDLLNLVDEAFNIGKRMDSALAEYRNHSKNLISYEYRKLNQQMHEAPRGFGGSGYKWAGKVKELIWKYRPESILDYGCGQGTLFKALMENGGFSSLIDTQEYDPAIRMKSMSPMPADLLVCTDVLEHIEPGYLHNVMIHIRSLILRYGFFVVANVSANKTLPNGRNAHLIVENMEWWFALLSEYFKNLEWLIEIQESPRPGKESVFFIRRRP